MQTNEQFAKAISACKEIFEKKLFDYGAAWRILRPESITDQIFIKAKRIRSFEVKKTQKINENIENEFIAIINYAIMALIQLELKPTEIVDISNSEAIKLYDKYAQLAMELMIKKNHDYDEAWRSMRISSYTDLILMKLYRIKQIEDNKGQTLISEGIDSNFYDIGNYAVFALIKFDEKKQIN